MGMIAHEVLGGWGTLTSLVVLRVAPAGRVIGSTGSSVNPTVKKHSLVYPFSNATVDGEPNLCVSGT